jgi:hypothetical protein
MDFFLPFLLLSFLVFSGRSYTSSWLRGAVVRGVFPAKVLSGRAKFGDIFGAIFVVFGWFSLDMLSSVVVTGFFWSGCVKPRPWWSLLLGAWPARDREFSPAELVGATACRFKWWLVDRCFQMSSAAGGLLKTALAPHSPAPATTRVLHTPVPVTKIPEAGCFCGYLAASYIFLFVHPCLCSQFTFVMGYKLLGHFRWLVT